MADDTPTFVEFEGLTGAFCVERNAVLSIEELDIPMMARVWDINQEFNQQCREVDDPSARAFPRGSNRLARLAELGAQATLTLKTGNSLYLREPYGSAVRKIRQTPETTPCPSS